MGKEEEGENQEEEKKAEEELKKMKDTNDYNSIQPGEYSIHLYIEETRNLISTDNE